MEHVSKLPSDVPAVLLGDFNATPEQSCYGFSQRGKRNPRSTGPGLKMLLRNRFRAPTTGSTGTQPAITLTGFYTAVALRLWSTVWWKAFLQASTPRITFRCTQNSNGSINK